MFFNAILLKYSLFSDSNDKFIATIKQHAGQSSKFREVLLAKAVELSKQPQSIPNREEFETILKKLGELFDILEKLLEINNSQKYFLSDSMTIMDICFGILLHRLDMLGLDRKLWGNRRRIGEYYQRIKELPSFQLSIPNSMSNCKALWSKLPDPYKLASIGLIVISMSSLGLISFLKLVLQ